MHSKLYSSVYCIDLHYQFLINYINNGCVYHTCCLTRRSWNSIHCSCYNPFWQFTGVIQGYISSPIPHLYFRKIWTIFSHLLPLLNNEMTRHLSQESWTNNYIFHIIFQSCVTIYLLLVTISHRGNIYQSKYHVHAQITNTMGLAPNKYRYLIRHRSEGLC